MVVRRTPNPRRWLLALLLVGLLLMGRPLTVGHATALHHQPIHVLAQHRDRTRHMQPGGSPSGPLAGPRGPYPRGFPFLQIWRNGRLSPLFQGGALPSPGIRFEQRLLVPCVGVSPQTGQFRTVPDASGLVALHVLPKTYSAR